MSFAVCSQIATGHDGSWWEVSAMIVKEAKGKAWLQRRAATAVFVDTTTTAWPVQKRVQLR